MCFGEKKGDFTDEVHLILSRKHVVVVVQRTQGYSESFVAYAKRCMATVLHLSCHHSALCVAADTRAQTHTHLQSNPTSESSFIVPLFTSTRSRHIYTSVRGLIHRDSTLGSSPLTVGHTTRYMHTHALTQHLFLFLQFPLASLSALPSNQSHMFSRSFAWKVCSVRSTVLSETSHLLTDCKIKINLQKTTDLNFCFALWALSRSIWQQYILMTRRFTL